MGVIDSEEEAADDSIDNDGSALDEDYGSVFVGAIVIEEVEDIKKAVKYSSVSSYILKPSHLLTHGFENNMTAH